VRLLLDTHILLWAVNEPHRVSAAAERAVMAVENELFVSAISSYEIANKYRLGKLPQCEVIVEAWPELIETIGASTMDLTSRHCYVAARLDWQHRDPFDRMLAAQAMLEGLTLVSSDTTFSTLPGLSLLW
jgi:PIN domain nuclease of toxin-antitoxin system